MLRDLGILAGLALIGYAVYRNQAPAPVAADPGSDPGSADAPSSPIFNLPNAPIMLTSDQAAVLATINDLNASQFGGFFDPADVMAFVSKESSFNPRAFLMDRNGGSYGLMQVDLPAAQQTGYTGPADGLFDPATNLQVGMAYLVWLWGYLSSHLGQAPSEIQWVSSYNAGGGATLRGYIATDYVARWSAYRDQWAAILANGVA